MINKSAKKIVDELKIILFDNLELGGFLINIKTNIVVQNITKIIQPIKRA